MPNDFYTRAYNPLPEQRVSSQVLKDEFARVEAGFDEVQSDADRAIKLPVGTADQTLAMDAVARANLVLAFNASGNITAISYGRYRGDWLTATAYVIGDYFRDPVSKNIYSTVIAHTSGVLVDDISAGLVQLAINVADAEAARAQAVEAAASAKEDAAAARAVSNFVGVWSAMSGPLHKPATVYHDDSFFALLNDLADVAASEPGETADWVAAGGIASYAYIDRGNLRTSAGQLAIVDGLGLFQHITGSDEPDDDESCFATITGRWLLQALHWDVVDAYVQPEIDAVAAAAAAAAKFLHGTATCAIESIAADSYASFTGTVTGATPGDRVIATPPAPLAWPGYLPLSYHAWVSADNTVSIMLVNNNSSVAYVAPPAQAAWSITVIKD